MRQTFTVTFSRNPVIVLILVGIPLLVVAVFLLVILSWAKNASDWVIIAIIILMMLTAIGGVLKTVTSWGMIRAEAAMDDEGISIRLLQHSPFYMRSTYISSWEGIENVSTNIDPQHNKRFYQLSFRQPSTTITLSPPDVVDNDSETPFGEALLSYVDRYNKSHANQSYALIKDKGFYDSWWAKLLTACAYVMSVAVIAMRFFTPDKVDTWRVIQVTAVCAMWLAAYHANHKRRKML